MSASEQISPIKTQDVIVTADVADMGKGDVDDVFPTTESAGIQKKKRNRHKPKPPKNGAAFVDYFLDRWIESLGSATAGSSSVQQDTGETALLTIRSASQTEREGNPHLN
jgi:hypothetical protein